MKQISMVVAWGLLAASPLCTADSYHAWEPGRLILDNGAIQRTIEFGKERKTVETVSILHGENSRNFVSPAASLEFSFDVDGTTYTGQDEWEYIGHAPVTDAMQGEGVAVTLRGTGTLSVLELDITYMLYPRLPLIRKHMTFRNKGDKEVCVESLDVENIRLNWYHTATSLYVNYARQQQLGTYVGDWDDPLIVVHNFDEYLGIALGNEAPGVVKRTGYHEIYENFSIGLTHADQDYGFRKWIQPGGEWVSPQVFVATYDNTTNPWDVVNSTVNDFTRKHMDIRLMQLKEKPVFVFNTWFPFKHDINEQLVGELTDAAAECGFEEFIIDDGWQRNRTHSDREYGGPVGDWLINEKKFPNGLTPVFDHIKAKGMKPGLWLSISSAHASSQIFADKKEWFVRDENGNVANIYADWAVDIFTTCFSTGWTDYIKTILLGLVKEHGLQYAKLDFSIVTSAYITDPARSGCYATDHSGHKDRNESLLNNYQHLLELFDELHVEVPELFIDCTFETMGKLHLIDYATVKYAEGDWISNFEEATPDGALRARRLAWWKTPVIPAGACVIGNLRLDSENLEFDFLSLVGTLPIMLGDPRNLSADQKAMLRKWSDWLREMQDTYDYMAYRQDLYCFGEPREGHWDGWARINTDSQAGGIIGVFNQGSVERSRLVTINWLAPDQTYSIVAAPGGEEVAETTGKQLETEGFMVSIENPYQGKLFEIKRLDPEGAMAP